MCDGGTASPELTLLNGLSLRGATGSAQTFSTGGTGTTGYGQFQTWLRKAASSTNMAYQLSGELAAMSLNVEAGFVQASAPVYAAGLLGLYPGGKASIGLGADGSITVTNLTNAAKAELALHGSVTGGSPYWAYQKALRDALNLANNNKNFFV
jgi:hypothetical protein